LHLCGWVDEQPDARAEMLQRQADLLTAFKQAGSDPSVRGE
jgi:hypothetical protein